MLVPSCKANVLPTIVTNLIHASYSIKSNDLRPRIVLRVGKNKTFAPPHNGDNVFRKIPTIIVALPACMPH